MNGPNLSLQPQQSVAFTSLATEMLYGGAAGAGKSHLIRAAAIAWAAMIPNLNIAIFRRLFPDLKANHLEGPSAFPVMLAPWIDSGHARVVQGEMTLWNGSRIGLHHCQHESDVFKYQGAEFHVLLMDELTHFTEYQYRYLRSRVRMTGVDVPPHLRGRFPRILCGANPGGVGHTWVKETFVDHGPMTIHRTTVEEGGMLRQFVPGRLVDNPALLLADPTYRQRLEGLGDPVLVRAMLEGDWTIIAGSMFGDVWRPARHICDPFPIPEGWELWRGADDGHAMPAACYWFTRDPDAGTIYVIRELYRSGMLPDEFAERVHTGDHAIPIMDSWGNVNPSTDDLDGVLDASAWSDTGQGSGGVKQASRGKQMNDLGCRWKPADKPAGSRIQRCQNLHRLLGPNKQDPQGRPGIIFFRSCDRAIKTIPALPRDKDHPEDVDTEAEDHAYDAVCYGLQRRFALRSKVRVKGF